METPASPPKRITRARAARSATSSTASSAAKAAGSRNDTTTTKPKTTRTAASANTSSTSSTVAASAIRTSTKRKTRSDDHDGDDESDMETISKRPPPASRTAPKITRGPGRPRKIGNPEPQAEPAPAPTRAPRGRPAKKIAIEPAKEEAPARTTRTRAKKTDADHDENTNAVAPQPAKKPTRGRPAGTATSTSAPTTKVKKTVTFAEPDKENLVPVSGPKSRAVANKSSEASATGMRAKPVRKPAGTSRATKATATKKTTKDTEERKLQTPLSPKKVTQLSVSRDRDAESEDELAMDRTLVRPFHRNPVNPHIGTTKPSTKSQEEVSDDEEHMSLAQTEPPVLLGSPVRRPPPSPFKNAMKSPAKRIDGLQLGLPAVKDTFESSVSPFKSSLLQSPAKRLAIPMKPIGLEPSSTREYTAVSPLKQSLFQSPAKRGFSLFKPAKAPEEASDVRSPAPKPVLLCTPPTVEGEAVKLIEAADATIEAEIDDDEEPTSPSRSSFNGRMSTLLPRETNPALLEPTSHRDEPIEDDDCETVVLEDEEQGEIEEQYDDPMTLDGPETETQEVAPGDISTTPPNSPPRETLDMFGLRQKDLASCDITYTESEDEATRVMTPEAVSPVKHTRGSARQRRASGFGFTPLARRFDEWQAHSPLKAKASSAEKAENTENDGPVSQESPTNNTFFEDEMSTRPGDATDTPVNETDQLASVPEIKDPVCEDISITDEDLELAAEANEMSTLSPEQVESMFNLEGNDDSISDASQEYGDENEIPGQAVQGGALAPPVTPKRFIRREFHTVSKVPLKPADESTPPPQPSLKKRRHSISKLPVSRPTFTLSRSATVISYSPSQNKQIDPAFEEAAEEESLHDRSASLSPPHTPERSEAWADAVTPMRTPRHDVNPALLRGAVVFVDVHTMEGADASAIFVELLTQMGARCVKTWNWNPNEEDASSKIGITHVVYKDGGKRTMEKVRESGGVVQCVGVGWVLDCERENEWLDEAPYYIDTSLIPRGGHRRRKSMEPQALANINGTLVPNSATRNAARESQAVPSTPAPANRRDSCLWTHSPNYDNGSGFNDFDDFDFEIPADQEWYNTAPLTPVPKTPAPEAIHRFAMDITPDTPTTDMGDGESIGVEEMLSREQLIQRTCPPKAQHMYHNMGVGILGLERDESVARRLMDARRKSLAFAPKVSSPLAKSWKEWN